MGKGKVDSKEVRSVRLLFIEGEMMHVMKAEKEEVGVHHALCDRQGEDLQTEVKAPGQWLNAAYTRTDAPRRVLQQWRTFSLKLLFSSTRWVPSGDHQITEIGVISGEKFARIVRIIMIKNSLPG